MSDDQLRHALAHHDAVVRTQAAKECAQIAKWYDAGGKVERGIRTHFGLAGIKFERESDCLLEYLARFKDAA